MPHLRDTLAVGALAVWAVGSAAATGRDEPSGGGLFDLGTVSNRKDPITINADRLEYDYKNNVVVYRGDVQATQGQVKLRSDTLTVTFESVKDGTAKDGTPPPKADPPVPDPAAKGTQRVHEVVAVGNVRIDQGARWATGGKAVFDQTQRTLVLTENPILHEGLNEVAGDRVVVYLDDNRSVVEGGRKHVKAVLYPNKDGTLGADGVAQHRRGVSYLPQEPSVFRKLTVEENIRAILETLDLTSDERAERCRRLLDELGIARLAKNKAYSLSGGERRRVEITRALVISPSFMLLDEPFAGIDPIAVVDIQNIVTQLKERGIGVLITDHNVRETLGICERAYILNEGTVLEEGIPARIAESARAREIYLGEKFRL